jgi:hypothetical protein
MLHHHRTVRLLHATLLVCASRAVAAKVERRQHLLEYARLHLRRLGSDYGGWSVVLDLLSPHSVIYSFGLGQDISWDLELIKASGAHVHGFDNTPRSNRFFDTGKAARQAERQGMLSEYTDKFHRHKVLLCPRDGNLTLALPVGHRSSYATLDGLSMGVKPGTQWIAPCSSVGTLLQQLGHGSRLDVLKLDVEGGEFDYFDALLRTPHGMAAAVPPVRRLPACTLLIEFHSRLQKEGYAVKAQAMLSLQSLGFTLIHNVVTTGGSDDAVFLNPRFCPALPNTA